MVEHKMKVKDLRILAALIPHNHGVIQAVEKLPPYRCSCGATFQTSEEADQHLEEVKGVNTHGGDSSLRGR
jgi:hypothetical protein